MQLKFLHIHVLLYLSLTGYKWLRLWNPSYTYINKNLGTSMKLGGGLHSFLLYSTRERESDLRLVFFSKLHVACKVTGNLPFSALALTDFCILLFIIYYFHKSVTYLRHGYLMKEEIINTRDDTFSFWILT